MVTKKKYRGISYPSFLSNRFCLYLWKRFMCAREWHLFDEVLSDEHYLSCDACDLNVLIQEIDTTYMDEVQK